MEDLDCSINISLFNMLVITSMRWILKQVEIDENSDTIFGGVKYDGTTGLWARVMMNDPPESSNTQNDLHMYKDLVYRTNVMSHLHNVVLGKSRYNDQKVDAYFTPPQNLTLVC